MREIPLSQGLVTIVDDDDYDWLTKWKWHAARGTNTYYAARSGLRRSGAARERFVMHRLILGLGAWQRGGPEADHIDRNGLNNQRSNLRIVSHQGNAINRDNRKLADIACETCGVMFHPSKSATRFCSQRCAGISWAEAIGERNRSLEQRRKVSAAMTGRPKAQSQLDGMRRARTERESCPVCGMETVRCVLARHRKRTGH